MLPEPLCYRLGRPIREECHGWSCTATLLIIRTTPKPGKMPHLNPCWRGQRHGFTPFCQSGDSPELAQGLPYKGKSMRNRGVSSPMPFLLIPRSLLRGGFICLGGRATIASVASLARLDHCLNDAKLNSHALFPHTMAPMARLVKLPGLLVGGHRDDCPEPLRAIVTPVNSQSGWSQTSDALGVTAPSAGRQSLPRAAA